MKQPTSITIYTQDGHFYFAATDNFTQWLTRFKSVGLVELEVDVPVDKANPGAGVIRSLYTIPWNAVSAIASRAVTLPVVVDAAAGHETKADVIPIKRPAKAKR